jgi:hypothetical protein
VRRALVLLACFAAFAVHAQRGLEGRATGNPGSDRISSSPASPTAPQRFDDGGRVSPGARDVVRPQTPQSTTRPQDQRARELPRARPVLPDQTRRSDIHPPSTTSPSPAQQMQQEQFERQQLQRQYAAPEQQAAPTARGSARCSAFPVCVREPGRYGSCQGVEQVYANANAGRRGIVAQCIHANSPDTCNCAAQCSRVAQCSIF